MAFDPNRRIVSIETARRILDESGEPVARTERVELSNLAGRVIAVPVVARSDVPPFARSAMDGYAVVAGDTASATPDAPIRLRMLEMIYTGSVASRTVASGSCSGIATGAPLPDGADAVVMLERTRRDGDEVVVEAPVRPGQHVAPRGSDIATGTTVLDDGAWLAPARVGVIAALGETSAVVYERPRVAILVTGNEVVPPGRPLGPGQIHDVNAITLAAVVESHGGIPVPFGIAADDPQQIGAALDATASADLVLASGGASVGERDYILDLFRARGEVLFEGIAVKPGMPTVFARLGTRLAFGMPGNPTSCLSNAYLLVVPLLRRIARLPPLPRRTVRGRLATRIASPVNRHQFYGVRVDGERIVPAFKGSGDITSLAAADGYIEIPVGVDAIDADTLVDVTLF